MKKAAVLTVAVLFAIGMVHYFYAEDHCPVHCPSKAGDLGHVHHHGGASSCLCFWSSLFGPETGDMIWAFDFEILTVLQASGRPRAPLGADIAHPPKSSLV